MAMERSRPRLAASTTSASDTCEDADWNSARPVATTLAMWLFLLRSAMEMASSNLPSRSAPATCCTKTRDCLRAALYIRARSIITPRDQAERIKRMNTTPLAMRLILPHIERKSHVPACNASKFSADTATFATIRFAPFHWHTLDRDLLTSRPRSDIFSGAYLQLAAPTISRPIQT